MQTVKNKKKEREPNVKGNVDFTVVVYMAKQSRQHCSTSRGTRDTQVSHDGHTHLFK